MNKLKLTQEDILENFQEKTSLKGHALYTNHRVQSHKIYKGVENEFYVISKVLDSKLYNQHIEFTLNDHISINSICSCSAKYNCEHVVAVLFEIVSETLKIEEHTITPIPYLELYKTEDNYTMNLYFKYDGHQYNSTHFDENEIIIQDETMFKIIRDYSKENEYIKKIESLGFQYHKSLATYVSTENTDIHAAMDKWRNFIENHAQKLRDTGWDIHIDNSFDLNFEYTDDIVLNSIKKEDTTPSFELTFSTEIGGKPIALVPLICTLLEEYVNIESIPEKLNLKIKDGTYLHLDSTKIMPMLTTIFELFDKKSENSLIIKPYDAHLVTSAETSNLIWKGDDALKNLTSQLKNYPDTETITPHKELKATLRNYQHYGLHWLHFLHSFKFSGILADDMGLGKTIQVLAFLQTLKAEKSLHDPVLIILPTSLIGNWKNEIIKFTPNLAYLELYGFNRQDDFKKIRKYDLILTTYQLAQRDKEVYKKEFFSYIILDEAQKIKNRKTQISLAIKSFRSTNKLALSGTPMENHLGELWSIFDFLMPGFLGDLKSFKSFYQNPIEKNNDTLKSELLHKKIAPFTLRRTKDEVAPELPKKTEIIKKVLLGERQRKLYQSIQVSMQKEVQASIKKIGLNQSRHIILNALLQLRQICCHPQLLKIESSKNIHESAKLILFLELIDELYAEERKMLVFSQFTSMLNILEQEISKKNYTYAKLTGSTTNRDEVIEKFTKGDAKIFLISLKAGGVGLNLTEADTVIHYDPWWNPAVEDQATDRVYRIGQNKPVFVYKLIVENSIEEEILKLQEKKKGLQDGLYSGQQNSDHVFNTETMLNLLLQSNE